MLDMTGRMVVLVTEIEMQMDSVCRWAKLSHLQNTVHEAGIPVGDIKYG